MEKLSILVVDDSIVYRKIISAAVENTGLATVTKMASNGLIALEWLSKETYDAVLMDVNMPELDGIETLRRIREKHSNLPVIILSSNGGKNAEVTLKALELGAMDFILKPLEENFEKNSEMIKNNLNVLFAQIRLKRAREGYSSSSIINQNVKTNIVQEVQQVKIIPKIKLTGVDLVLVASSTGGPVALEKFFSSFDKNFAKPILLVQHMPKEFTKVLADSLNKKSPLTVIEGKDGDVVRAGQVIVAPGGFHMIIENIQGLKKVKLIETEYVNGVRPAADVLFKSVASEMPGLRILTVILTGMGNDGMSGVAALKQACKCYTICQSERTCVVYGMPRSVVESKLEDEVVDIEEIAKRVQQIALGGS